MVDINSYRKFGKFKIFKQGDFVCMQNDPGNTMYVVFKGVFGVYINSFTDFPMRVASIPEGAFFGEMSVIDGSPRSATIVSEEEQGMAITVGEENFAALLSEHPEIAEKILKTLSGRAESTAVTAIKNGKSVKDLPEELKNPVLSGDSITDFETMMLLARRIRELNELLGVGGTAEVEVKEDAGFVIPLLPPGHKRFDVIDDTEYGSVLAPKKLVCPYCRNEFEDRVPFFSNLEAKEHTIDQRIVYFNLNILIYNNIVCPNCNYCDSYQEFNKYPGQMRPKVNGIQFPNAEGFTGYANKTKHTLDEGILSHYLQLACLDLIPDSGLRKAKAWQRLYWLYNDNKEAELAKSSAEQSFKYYNLYYEINLDTLSTPDILTLNAILGELCIAKGDLVEARSYFTKNCEMTHLSTEPIVQRSLARIRDIRYMTD